MDTVMAARAALRRATRFGAACGDITPASPGAIAGMSDPQFASGASLRLSVRAFAVVVNQRAALVVTFDLLNISSSTTNEIKAGIHERTDLAPESVLLACSHTHSAPFTTFFAGYPADRDYLTMVVERAVSTAEEAWAATRPAQFSVGWRTVDGLAFNRRAILANNQVATHCPPSAPGFVGYESRPDRSVCVLVARDERQTVLGGLVNFACHPTLTGFDGVYSADYPGAFRAELEGTFGGLFGFLQGASGDIQPFDESRQTIPNTGIAAAKDFAAQLSNQTAPAVCESVPFNHEATVNAAATRLFVKQREVSADEVAAARRYLLGELDGISQIEVNRHLRGFDYTFFRDTPDIQRWFAHEVVGMWEWQNRADVAPLTDALELQILSIGPVTIFAAPCELFADVGRRIKVLAGNPQAAMISALSNGFAGYVPTRAAFERGGYETRLGFQSRLDPCADSLITTEFRVLLAG